MFAFARLSPSVVPVSVRVVFVAPVTVPTHLESICACIALVTPLTYESSVREG